MTQLPILAKNHCAMCGYLLDDDLNCPECEVCHPSDKVNHPTHYTTGKVECIVAMESMMDNSNVTPIMGNWWGNVFKYVWRWDKKGTPIEQLKKARFYLDRMIKRLEEDEVHDKNKTN